jgi:hypothetical protein
MWPIGLLFFLKMNLKSVVKGNIITDRIVLNVTLCRPNIVDKKNPNVYCVEFDQNTWRWWLREFAAFRAIRKYIL